MTYLIETVSPMLVNIEVRKVVAVQMANEDGLEFAFNQLGEVIEEETVIARYSYNPITHKVRIENGKFTFITRASEN